MQFGIEALGTLAAVCDEGTFAAAAARLHITTGAVSQRIAALERQVGHPVVARTQPAMATEIGHELLQLARQSLLLQQETAARLAQTLHAEDPAVRVTIAVNADSLSTWFRPVVQTIGAEGRWLLDLRIEDQDRTAHLLRSGAALAAVTTDPEPGAGCTVEQLGTMRYYPVCSPAIAPQPDEDLSAYLSSTPMLQFDSLDLLPKHFMDQFDVKTPPPAHFIPSNREYFDAVCLGLGWSVLPEGQLQAALETEDLVLLHPTARVDVDLYWQRWRLQSATLDRITDLVRRAATSSLHN
ncbi:ArgP/LysG family DNA-binding transcriptional regulator [Nocardioides bruguierae]|uniref:ArgP/LysG family DNA-binding transcriptional regulator n=1 Tax=Nocardioides bruguierae TaxID=2945102 RepID=A0A9X2D9T2_9ACTN|nr:ArgP/LysG family DNA-binding transcriptional regulator [Nocardioides bruguierae]MCM0621785.1 ArgP/LysG family DNA-binding transcriptional regulator [Nocardioides bruguierae]